ncbi:MAG TPA: [FeFe] hydrogenase H-cluster radical SAM maturase HydE [Thermodesulfobacteriota bacterium]
MIRERFLKILQAGERGEGLSSEDLDFLLSAEDQEEDGALFQTAERVRQEKVGNEVHLRGIVEFSNICVQNCMYCGLRRDNRRLRRYRMTPGEILGCARDAMERGLKTVVLQSGEDPWFTQDRLSGLIRRIKEETDLAITLSVGERPAEDYRAWKRAGADRYLLKQETASPALFARLRPGRTLTERLDSLRALKELGYEVGSGNMVGLPGQTAKDLVSDIQLFKELDFDMIGIGPFIPHPSTPLAESPPGDLHRSVKILAVTRIVTGNTHLPATTASGVLDPQGRKKALLAGANVIMPDITPRKYRQHYDIYPGKTKPKGGMDSLVPMITSLGRVIGRGAGNRRLPSPGHK